MQSPKFGLERKRDRGTDFVRLSESAVSAEAQLPSDVHLCVLRWRGLHHFFQLGMYIYSAQQTTNMQKFTHTVSTKLCSHTQHILTAWETSLWLCGLLVFWLVDYLIIITGWLSTLRYHTNKSKVCFFLNKNVSHTFQINTNKFLRSAKIQFPQSVC